MEQTNTENSVNWKKNIAIFMTAQGLSLFGSMVVFYAIYWHMVVDSNSGVMMMLITLVGAIPMFLISPFGGVWADRYNKKNLINISDGCIAIVTLILAISFFFGVKNTSLLLICLAARSFGQGIQMPAVSALIPELAPTEKLTKINGINGSIQSLTTIIAPVVAFLLISIIPLNYVLFIDITTAIIGISLLYFFVKTKPVEKKDAKVTYFSELKEGLSYTNKHVFVKKFLVLAAFFGIISAPVAMLSPLQVIRDFGPGEWKLTAIEIVFSVGSMLGGVIIGLWGGFKNKSHTMALATTLSGIAVVLLGVLNHFWLYLTCMGIGGALIAMFNPPMMSVLQTNVEEHFMGRVFSLLTMVSSVAMPLGMLIWGPLSDIVKIDYLLWGTGIAMFLMGLVFVFDKTMLKAGIAMPAEAPVEETTETLAEN